MKDEIEELNGTLISISPEKIDRLKSKEVEDATTLITSDNNNGFAKRLGLVFELSNELNDVYLSFGIDLNSSNGSDSHELPMPATIITDSNHKIKYVFADEDYTKRVEPDTILEILKDIN